jgi:hypothetical protein
MIAVEQFIAVCAGEALKCLPEGLPWLGSLRRKSRIAGKSAISQVRTRSDFL